MKKLGLTSQVLIATVAGAVAGVLLSQLDPSTGFFEVTVNGIFEVIGKLFLNALKMLVVPIVFVSLVCGVCSVKEIKTLGQIGIKTFALYMGTTAIAITLALFFSILLQPGAGFSLPTDVNFQVSEAPSITEVIANIVPANPFEALVQGEMLQIIFFAILFGIALNMSKLVDARLVKIFNELNDVLMKLIGVLMVIAPYGVFALIAKVFATQGLGAIAPLAKYFFLVLFVLLVHGLLVYPLLLKVLGGLNPMYFLQKIKDPLVFSFSTASSTATIPVTLETAEKKMGVDNSVASFTIPLGATINMDGTAIMQGCATVFIAQAYAIDIGLTGYLTVILTATLASIGTAGVPGVGLITLAMVLNQVGLPVDGIALIIGIDRLLDMVRTSVNITGDTAITCVVAKRHGYLDETIYNSLERSHLK